MIQLEHFKNMLKKLTGNTWALCKKYSGTSSPKLFLVGFLPILATTAFFFWGSWSASRNFSRITEDLFHREMLENTLNMHYTLAYPEDFGLKDYDAVLPGYRSEAREEALEQTEEILEALQN